MSHKSKFLKAAAAVICMVSMLIVSLCPTSVSASSGYEFVILSTYSATMEIGDEFYLIALTSTGKKPSFSSSASSVASVNTYGKVTAKKAGTAVITAKIKNGEASCKVKVLKTTITLDKKSITLENGYSTTLSATASNGHPITFKSAKKSIATVDEDGLVTAKKPGTTTITASADKSTATCKVTVKEPTVKLGKSKVSLYRKETVKLTVKCSSKSTPKWKTNKKSVATVDSDGTVTAVKNGTATITVTVDGVSKSCEVTVKKPTISFAEESVTLAPGESYQAKATVSSGIKPSYSSSNTNVATVDEDGEVHALSKGRAYIYAKEDGTKARMTVYVKTE